LNKAVKNLENDFRAQFETIFFYGALGAAPASSMQSAFLKRGCSEQAVKKKFGAQLNQEIKIYARLQLSTSICFSSISIHALVQFCVVNTLVVIKK
jgi:hypothetical protein